MVLGEGDEGGDSTKRVEPIGDVDEAFLVVLTGPGAGADWFRDFSDVVGDILTDVVVTDVSINDVAVTDVAVTDVAM